MTIQEALEQRRQNMQKAEEIRQTAKQAGTWGVQQNSTLSYTPPKVEVPEEQKTSADKMWDRNSQPIKIEETTRAKQKRDKAKKEYDSYINSAEYKQNQIADMIAQQIARDKDESQPIASGSDLMPVAPREDERAQQLRAAMEQAEQEYNESEDRKVIEQDLEAITGLSEDERKQLEQYFVNRDLDYYEGITAASKGDFSTPYLGRAEQEAADLIEKYGLERVNEMANTLDRMRNAEMTESVSALGQQQANSGFFGGAAASAASVPVGVLSGPAGILDRAKELARKDDRFKTLDPNSLGNLGNVYSGAVRGQVGENIVDTLGDGFLGKAASIGYQGLMSSADSVARAYMGGGAFGGASLAATGSFSQTMADASRNGATPAQAALLATTTAGIEALTEEIPLDNLIRTAKGQGFNSAILNALRQAGIEATTEEVSLIGTILAEAAILQEKSGYQRDVMTAIMDGASVDDAVLQASQNIVDEAINTALVSMISGGISSLGGSHADYQGWFAEEQAQNNPALNQPKQEDVIKSKEALLQKYGQADAQQTFNVEQDRLTAPKSILTALENQQKDDRWSDTVAPYRAADMEAIKNSPKAMQWLSERGMSGDLSKDLNAVQSGKYQPSQQTQTAETPQATPVQQEAAQPAMQQEAPQRPQQPQQTTTQQSEEQNLTDIFTDIFTQQQEAQQAQQQTPQPQTQQSLDDIFADMFTQQKPAQSDTAPQTQTAETPQATPVQQEAAQLSSFPVRDQQNGPKPKKDIYFHFQVVNPQTSFFDDKSYMNDGADQVHFTLMNDNSVDLDLSAYSNGINAASSITAKFDTLYDFTLDGNPIDPNDPTLQYTYVTFEDVRRPIVRQIYGGNYMPYTKGTINLYSDMREVPSKKVNNHVPEAEPMQATETSEQATMQASTPTADMQMGANDQSVDGGQIKGTGAAERNFSGVAAYEDMLSDDNMQRQRPNAVRDVEMPKFDSDGRRVTEFAKNVSDAEVTPEPLADAVKSLVGDKKLSFDTRSNQESLNNAAEAIRAQGDTAVIADIHAHAEAKTVKDGDIEKGLVLYAQYANDPDPKSQETAAQIIVDMAALANMSGRNLQLFSLMQRLTPEGRIKVLKKDLSRSIKQINAGRSKNKQVDLSKPGVMTDKKATEAVTAAKNNTEKQVRGASDRVRYKGGKVEVEGNQAGEPFVFEYAQKVGEALAKGLENSQKKKPQKTFLQTITSELRKFAAEKMPAAQREKQLTPTELLRDYIQNQDFYAEAWSAAQETLRQKYGNDPQYQEFINSGIGVDANANPQNKIMAKALAATAMETGETTEMLRKQQALGITGMSENIASKLISDTGATGEMAQTIRDAAYEFVKNRINEADSREKAKTYDAGYFVEQAMRDIKQSMTDVAKKNTQGRAAAKQAVIDALTKKYGIGQADARNIADVVGDTFDQKAQEQARKILEQKFGEREKTQPKSAGQMIEEYANLGAYDQESQYSEQATESFLRAAMRDIGTTVSEIAKSGKADKEAVLSQISLMITERHGIDKADANNIARVVVDQMNKMTEAQAQKILEQKFRDRPERNKKTSQQVFEELANLGAFDVGSNFNEAASKKVLGDDVDVYINEELAQKFLDAKTDKEKEAVMDEIYKDVASRIKPTLGEVWDAWRNLAMLGNFKTHERNIISTAAYQPYQSVKRGIGTVLEKTLRLDPEQRTKSVLGIGKKSQDLLKWTRADAKNDNVQKLMQRSGTTGNEARSAIQEYRQILPGILDKASKKNMELMEKADMRFKKREYALSLASFLKARGYTAADLQNGNVPNGVLDEGRQIAVREAMKATFNDSNKFSDAAVRYMKANERDGSKIFNIVKKGTIPFLRTPANVVARAVENNPLTMVANLATAKKDIESGRKSAADVLDGLSANLAGGVGVAIGALLGSGAFENVELIGSIEDEEELQEGAQEYSVRIGDKYYNVAWLAPAMIPLFLGANMARNGFLKEFRESDGWDKGLAILNLGADTLEPILELSMLSSLNDAVKKFTNEENLGYGAMAVFLNSLTSYVQQGLPTIIGQAEQATETEKSSTFVNTDNKLEEIMKNAISYASKRVPGVDLYQTQKLDEWGNVVQNEGDADSRIFNAFFNPSTVTTRKTDPVMQEIARLNKSQENNVSPNYAPKVITYTDKEGNLHKDQRLTEEQYQTFAKTQGQTARQLVEELIKSRSYETMSDEQKAEAINLAYTYARETAEKAAFPDSLGYSEKWLMETDAAKNKAGYIMNKVGTAMLSGAMGKIDSAWDNNYSAENVKSLSDQLAKDFEAYSKMPRADKTVVYEGLTGTTKKYVEAREKGVSHDDFMNTAKAINDVKGTGKYDKNTGKNAVRDIDKRAAIAGVSNLTPGARDILMKAYMTDYDPTDESPTKTEPKYDFIRQEMGLSAKDYVNSYRVYLDVSGKNNEIIGIMNAINCDYATARKLRNLYGGWYKGSDWKNYIADY